MTIGSVWSVIRKMKMYDVNGIYKDKNICKAVVDNYSENEIKVELWYKKDNFNNISLGQEHYNTIQLLYINREDSLSMLFNKKDGTTARKYLKILDLKIIKKVI